MPALFAFSTDFILFLLKFLSLNKVFVSLRKEYKTGNWIKVRTFIVTLSAELRYKFTKKGNNKNKNIF